MEAALFAGLGTLALASANTVTKRGTISSSVPAGALVSIASGNVLLWTVLILDPPDAIRARSIPYFLAAGLVGSALGRWAAIAGVHGLGPSTAVPIHASVYPVFAVLGAILLLGEPVTLARAFGVASIVLGIVVLTGGDGEHALRQRRLPRLAFAYPVVAGLSFGAADLLRKAGIDDFPEPVFAQAVGFAGAMVTFTLLSFLSQRFRGSLVFGRQAGWFVAAGVLNSLGLLSSTYALSIGEISVVSPIVAAEPLVVVVLSAVLLRNLDRVTPRTVMAVVLTVAGVLMVVSL